MKLKVMADYDCWPIWYDGGRDVGPVDPSTLGLSAELVRSFERWQDEYDRSLNRDDPVASRLPDEDRFERDGRRLAEALQQELGSAHVVRYWRDERPSSEAL